jgi:hypothetical protein
MEGFKIKLKKMKNIHVLPTDKPSRLLVRNDKPFVLMLKEHSPFATNDTHQNQNIYITSNEEIKDRDWYLNGVIPTNERINKSRGTNSASFYRYKDVKKIILTTDQDLIKDGVQAIDDDFLEWFVKNPSCEYIQTTELSLFNGDTGESGHYKYEIIIPQEELKQENRKVCKCKRAYENPLSEICSLCWNELYPNEKDEIKEEDLLEPKQETCMFCEGTGQIVSSTTISGFKTCDCINIPKQEQKQHLIDLMRLEKQETLEEAAEKRIPTSTKVWDLTETRRNDFIAGAKSDAARDYWFKKFQQEQDKKMYSEEEVEVIAKDAYTMGRNNILIGVFNKWFEQFKNEKI